MARRPKASGESAYQRRIRLYKERHPGATTQEARGKGREAQRGGEHRQRVAKEKAAHGGYTIPQSRTIDDIAERQAHRIYGRSASAAQIAKVRRDLTDGFAGDYSKAAHYRNTLNRLNRNKRERGNRLLRGKGKVSIDRIIARQNAARARALDDMEELLLDLGLDDIEYAYYN